MIASQKKRINSAIKDLTKSKTTLETFYATTPKNEIYSQIITIGNLIKDLEKQL